MSAPAFTPGPWELLQRPAGNGITGAVAADFIIPASLSVEERECVADYAVARCLTSLNGYDPIAERTANARLIAAAPELYGALEAMLAERSAGDCADYVKTGTMARAALAKARDAQ